MKFKAVHLAIVTALVLAGCATGVEFPSTGADSDLKVRGLLFKPKGEGVHPAVVLLHTCGGLKPHVTEDWPGYLTGLGYVVLSVDSYGPRGVSRCTGLPRGGRSVPQARDAYGALDYLVDLPFVNGGRVGVMGFSSGAVAINDYIVNSDLQRSISEIQALIDAINTHEAQIGARASGEIDPKRKQDGREFKAAIAFYGRCNEIGAYTKKSVPLMEIVAEKDERHAPRCIDAGKEAPIEVHALKGAYHAFDQTSSRGQMDPFGSIMIYSAAAVTEAEKHVKSFLAKHLGK